MEFHNKTLNDKLDLYKNGYQNLKTVLDSLPNEVLLFSPDKDHWTAKQIAIHLADTEGIYFIRFRRTISENGYELTGFKNDDWAIELQYDKQDLNFNMQMLNMLRQSNLKIFQSMPTNYWQDKKYKNGNELLPLEKLLERNLNHFYGHLDVIKKRFNQYKDQQSK